jgi:Ca2+-binding EF-hand superfamily protein
MAWLDSDGDGTVSRSEFDAGGASRFTESDTDGDGQLSAEELEAAHERMREQMRSERAGRHQDRVLARFDADDNGLVSREEFDAARAGLFEQLDADGDGVVRQDEGPRWHDGRGRKDDAS